MGNNHAGDSGHQVRQTGYVAITAFDFGIVDVYVNKARCWLLRRHSWGCDHGNQEQHEDRKRAGACPSGCGMSWKDMQDDLIDHEPNLQASSKCSPYTVPVIDQSVPGPEPEALRGNWCHDQEG
jgi:hypothetical protein